MSKRLNWNLILSLIVVVLAGVVLWRVLDVGTKWEISRAVSDLQSGNQPDKARERLFATNDRGAVLEALAEALEESGGTPEGKFQVIWALDKYKASGPIERALSSENVTTRYAAGSYLHRRRADEETCKKIALEWLADKSVGSRAQAVVMAKDLGLTEAIPALIEIIETPEADLRETRAALDALSGLNATGVAEKILELVRGDGNPRIRSVAMKAVNKLELSDEERESLRKTLVSILKDKGADQPLRINAALELPRDSYNTPETLEAVESVLFDSSDDWYVQRACLKCSAKFRGAEGLKELMHDRRVYQHPYFGIRHDVSTALYALKMRDKLSFDILCDYLVDESRDDSSHIVRRDAWLSLWMLTGIVHGIQESDLFRRAPLFSERVPAMRNVFEFSYLRSGVTRGMAQAVKAHVADLEKMQATRQVLQDRWPEVQTRWEKEREKAAKKRKAREDEQKAFEEKSKKAKDAAKNNDKGGDEKAQDENDGDSADEADKDGTDKEPRENSAPGNKDND